MTSSNNAPLFLKKGNELKSQIYHKVVVQATFFTDDHPSGTMLKKFLMVDTIPLRELIHKTTFKRSYCEKLSL